MQAKAAPAKWCWAWRTAAVSTCWSTCWVKPQDLFDEFAGKHKEHLGTGDVKYHMGFFRYGNRRRSGAPALAFNPSHLEIVSPVVIGSVRARLDRLDEPSSNKVLPITIHGDAAVTGRAWFRKL